MALSVSALSFWGVPLIPAAELITMWPFLTSIGSREGKAGSDVLDRHVWGIPFEHVSTCSFSGFSPCMTRELPISPASTAEYGL